MSDRESVSMSVPAMAPIRFPHPAAGPYDKRISETLGLHAFEMYQVELPAGGETVLHNHVRDGAEDAYAFIGGSS